MHDLSSFVGSLDKPLIFFDIESTGLDTRKDRIIDLACVKLWEDKCVRRFWRCNPMMPIPQQSTDIHGIEDHMVASCPDFSTVAEDIFAFFSNSDVGGFNISNFDIMLLTAEFSRFGFAWQLDKLRILDCKSIFHKMESRTLQDAYFLYTGKKMENAHNAMEDVNATIQVFQGQLRTYNIHSSLDSIYEDLGMEPISIVDSGRAFCLEKDQLMFNMGKYRGQPVRAVSLTVEGLGYMRWMLKSDFPSDTKNIVSRFIERLG